MRAALLEDDKEVAGALKSWLAEAGHQVTVYENGLALLREQRRESFDFYLLDWQVPGATGEEVLRRLRRELNVTAPVLFVTARDSEEDVASVLDAGADDFLVKPLRRRELLARIDAVIRRLAAPHAAGTIRIGSYEVDMAAREVRVDGQRADLTETEFQLATFLFSHADGLVSKGHIAQSVWGHNADVVSRTVDVHVSKLRRKLKLGPERGLRLATIYGFGYRLERVHPNEGDDG
jgi:DNA-binding response OmpR family regulator